eukprot:scaffold69926_cov63-Phaeocystis_antarctica.AAC.5
MHWRPGAPPPELQSQVRRWQGRCHLSPSSSRHRIVVVGVVIDAVAAVAAVAAVVVVALAAARSAAVPLGHETEQQRRVEGEAVDRRLGLGPRLVAAQRRRVLGVCLGSQ